MTRVSVEFTGSVYFWVDTDTEKILSVTLAEVDRKDGFSRDYIMPGNGNLAEIKRDDPILETVCEIIYNSEPEDIPTVELEW